MISNQRSFAAAHAYRDTTIEVVERFLPMVRKLAWHLQSFARSGIDPEDLVQAGLVALTECAHRHGGDDSDGFAAYAKIRVRGAMIDQLRRFAPISRGAAQRRRELREVEDRLRARLGREPAEAELAEAMALTPAEFAALRSDSTPMQFDPIDDAYSDCDIAFSDQSPDAFEELVTVENRDALVDAIGGLPERLQLVIQLYFVEELNLSDIAKILGLSVPRIHQLKDQAMQKLKGELQRRGIDGA